MIYNKKIGGKAERCSASDLICHRKKSFADIFFLRSSAAPHLLRQRRTVSLDFSSARAPFLVLSVPWVHKSIPELLGH